MATSQGARGGPPADILLTGVGRDAASLVHALDHLPDGVDRVFVTASPTRPLASSPALVPIRGGEDWQGGLALALAGARMVVGVATLGGREEKFTPEILSLARRGGAVTVAVLVEPLLTSSPCRREAAGRLVKEVMRTADATALFTSIPEGAAALTVREALERWNRRVSAALRGLAAAAAAEDAVNMDFADVAAVLSGHSRATVGAGRGQTVEDALRDALKNAPAPRAELEAAHSVVAHVVVGGEMRLDDARRATPVLGSLFPRAEVCCGVSVGGDQDEILATVIAGKIDLTAAAARRRRRTPHAESPFFKVGDPTVYDGENLDIPAFIRKDLALPGSPPRPVPAQKTLFERCPPARG